MTTNVLIPVAGTLTLGGTDVVCQIQDARVNSQTPNITVQTMCGSTTTPNSAQTTRTLDLVFLQDWHSGGISKYLKDHVGQRVAFVWTPSTDGTPSATGYVYVVEPSFGGAAGIPADDRLSLPLDGDYGVTTDA